MFVFHRESIGSEACWALFVCCVVLRCCVLLSVVLWYVGLRVLLFCVVVCVVLCCRVDLGCGGERREE